MTITINLLDKQTLRKIGDYIPLVNFAKSRNGDGKIPMKKGRIISSGDLAAARSEAERIVSKLAGGDSGYDPAVYENKDEAGADLGRALKALRYSNITDDTTTWVIARAVGSYKAGVDDSVGSNKYPHASDIQRDPALKSLANDLEEQIQQQGVTVRGIAR